MYDRPKMPLSKAQLHSTSDDGPPVGVRGHTDDARMYKHWLPVNGAGGRCNVHAVVPCEYTHTTDCIPLHDAIAR